MRRRKPAQLPFTLPGTHRACAVDVPSFTKGLVTLVPSDAAGKIAAPQGDQASVQAQTVQFGPDSKDAVVRASNVRFRDKSTWAAPGYQAFAGSLPGPVLFATEVRLQASTALILGTTTDLYQASPAQAIFLRAGPQQIVVGLSTTLSATLETALSGVTLAWSQLYGAGIASFSDSTVLGPTVTASATGLYCFALVATSADGSVAVQVETVVTFT
jgi:hypothetical protein